MHREWDALANRLAADPFHRPEWLAAWMSAFGVGELVLVTARDDSGLTGVLPLVGDRTELVTPTNGHSYHFGALARSKDAADLLLTQLVAERPHHVSLLLPEDDPVVESITSGRVELPYEVETTVELLAPWVNTGRPWAEYIEEVATRRRSEIRRRRRKLSAEGDVSLTIEDGTDALDSHFDEFLRVEASGWKSQSGTAVQSRVETIGFYRDIAHWAAERGWLCLAALRLDGRPIAVDLSLEIDHTHYLLKTGYDPEFSKFGPGHLLRWDMLERAFAGDVQRYEFMGTAEGDRNDWKLGWTTQMKGIVRVELFEASAVGRLRRRSRRLGNATKREVRRMARRLTDREMRRRLRELQRSLTRWLRT